MCQLVKLFYNADSPLGSWKLANKSSLPAGVTTRAFEEIVISLEKDHVANASLAIADGSWIQPTKIGVPSSTTPTTFSSAEIYIAEPIGKWTACSDGSVSATFFSASRSAAAQPQQIAFESVLTGKSYVKGEALGVFKYCFSLDVDCDEVCGSVVIDFIPAGKEDCDAFCVAKYNVEGGRIEACECDCDSGKSKKKY